jgi:hypothetical protein
VIICLVAGRKVLVTNLPQVNDRMDTNPNWTIVKVTGYWNWPNICFPILFVTALEQYQAKQVKASRSIENSSFSKLSLGG